MQTAVKAIACIATLPLLALPARADDFCDGLNKVIAAAPAQFESIRGAAWAEQPAYYIHAYALPGAIGIDPSSPCAVALGGGSASYSCSFSLYGGSVAALTNRVAACLGTPPPPIAGADYRSASAHFALAMATIDLGVALDPDSPGGRTVLSIAAPR